MKRIVVLGSAGSGKTTFAEKLGAHAGFPVIVLDDIWQAGWTEADVPNFRLLLQASHEGERWVSDGNFAKATFDIRLPQADLIIWMERPRLTCAANALLRAWRKKTRHRRSDLKKSLVYIWNFNRVSRPLIERTRNQVAPGVPVLRLRSRAEADAFIAHLA